MKDLLKRLKKGSPKVTLFGVEGPYASTEKHMVYDEKTEIKRLTQVKRKWKEKHGE